MSDHGTSRRRFLMATGATGLAAAAGCMGFGGGGGGDSDEEYVSAAQEMGFMDNWRGETEVLSIYIHRFGINLLDYGFASAVSVFLVGITLIVAAVYVVYILERIEEVEL